MGTCSLQIGPKLEKRANSVACVSNSSSSGASVQTVNKSFSEDHGSTVVTYSKAEESETNHYGVDGATPAEEKRGANTTVVNITDAPSVSTPRPSISSENNILLDPEIL